jgi:hypothetical protein
LVVHIATVQIIWLVVQIVTEDHLIGSANCHRRSFDW